jgi:hypothetical protein
MGLEGPLESGLPAYHVRQEDEGAESACSQFERAAFATWVGSKWQRSAARLLIESIRSFGGVLADIPIFVLESDPARAPCDALRGDGVHIHRLALPESVKDYLFADKVYAGAMAEELTADDFSSLVWLSPDCVVVNPPVLYALDSTVDVAVRPVHIRNVGSPATGPVDPFWRGVYGAVGVEDVPFTVESFVDVKTVRAYFNSAAYSVNPSMGLLCRWRDVFTSLVCDGEYQATSCRDELHQVFLHQAVLSTLIATSVARHRIRILPPEYGYPYNLHGSLPDSRKARSMNPLVCVIYEDRTIDPDLMSDIELLEPLRSWLLKHASSKGSL